MKSLVLEGNATGGNADHGATDRAILAAADARTAQHPVRQRYLFSGSATDQPSVATYDDIINGDGTRAGLTQIIGERNQADLGANGLGRLASARRGRRCRVAEDAVSPFGFKLAG